MHASYFRPALTAVALFGLVAVGSPAVAGTISFTSNLKASEEIPPNDSKGTGTVAATYDTASKMFSWTITYSGLTGPATAAHFHGPAQLGFNAPPVIPISGSLKSPIKGETALTEAQAKDLEAGLWYFNVHTAAHPSGEIRAQLVKK